MAVVLLGCHIIKGGLQVAPYRRYGVLLAEERDGVFELVTVVAKLECRHGVEGMLGLVDRTLDPERDASG